MKSFFIQDIRIFMQQLLTAGTFDTFEVVKAELRTWASFSVDGEIPVPLRKTDAAGGAAAERYVSWSRLRPHFLELIRGKDKPLSLHLVFRLADRNIPVFLRSSGLGLQPDEIAGLYLNVNYTTENDREQVSCVTGLSLKIFTLDKSAEHIWDEMCEKLLRRSGIPYVPGE